MSEKYTGWFCGGAGWLALLLLGHRFLWNMLPRRAWPSSPPRSQSHRQSIFQKRSYAQDGNEPPHIHVAKAGCDAKLLLSPTRLSVNHGFKPHDLREISEIVDEDEQSIVEKI